MLWDQVIEWFKGLVYATQPGRLVMQRNGDLIFCGHRGLHAIVWSAYGLTCDCETFWRFLPLGGWCRHIFAAVRILTAVDEGTALVCEAEPVH
jgi:hypothetical protein